MPMFPWICNKSPLHFFHPFQFPALKLHDDLVQLGALAQSLNSWSLGIALDLLHGFLPLQLCLGALTILAYGIELVLGQYL